MEVDLLNTTYDYGSIMHYPAYGFAVDRNIPTIIPLDPKAVIGQIKKMSALDVERVQILYSCKKPVSVVITFQTFYSPFSFSFRKYEQFMQESWCQKHFLYSFTPFLNPSS